MFAYPNVSNQEDLTLRAVANKVAVHGDKGDHFRQ
jgi:hypothetical protein